MSEKKKKERDAVFPDLFKKVLSEIRGRLPSIDKKRLLMVNPAMKCLPVITGRMQPRLLV